MCFRISNMANYIIGLIFVIGVTNAAVSPSVVNYWNLLKFDIPDEIIKQYLSSGFYVKDVPAPIDTDYDPIGDRYFVTIPRFQIGSPITLGYVKRSGSTAFEPKITPYPSLSWHYEPRSCNKDRLISVYRIQIDKCGRMWVLDTGKFGDEQTCNPQLIAFDLKTNTVLYRSDIPRSLIDQSSILVTPIADIGATCQDTYVYMADCQAYAIIVADIARNRMWKASHNTMYPDSRCSTYSIQGNSFELMDGVFGLGLGGSATNRTLFYHSMSGTSKYSVPTSHLKNGNLLTSDPTSNPELYKTLPGNRESQTAAVAIDQDGMEYFFQMTPTSLYCWNSYNQAYGGSIKFVYKQSTILQFPSGIKIVNIAGVEYIITLTSRFQILASTGYNANEVNFRIVAFNKKQVDEVCKDYYNQYYVQNNVCGGCKY